MMKGVVFVSYENHDSSVASSLCSWLESQGCECWIAPRDIVSHDDYAGEITRAIKSASAFVLICSDTTKNSEHVLSEVNLAFTSKITIVPYCLKGAVIGDSLEYFLASKHRIEATSDWESDCLSVLAALESDGAGTAEAEPGALRTLLTRILIGCAVGAIVVTLPRIISERAVNSIDNIDSQADTTTINEPPADTSYTQTVGGLLQETATAKMQETADAKEKVTVHETAVRDVPAEDTTAWHGVSSAAGATEGSLAEDASEKPETGRAATEPLRNILAQAKSIHDLDGACTTNPVTIDTPEETLSRSYILICHSDGSIISILSPLDADGERTDIVSGAATRTISYSKSDRVEYILP